MQQLSGYEAEEKLFRGVRERRRLNTTGLDRHKPLVMSRFSDLSSGVRSVQLSCIWHLIQLERKFTSAFRVGFAVCLIVAGEVPHLFL
jgi:hypothetical protein